MVLVNWVLWGSTPHSFRLYLGALIDHVSSYEAPKCAATRFAAREAILHDVPLTLMRLVPLIPNWPTSPRQRELATAWEADACGVIEQGTVTLRALWISACQRAKCSDNIGQEDSRWL